MRGDRPRLSGTLPSARSGRSRRALDQRVGLLSMRCVYGQARGGSWRAAPRHDSGMQAGPPRGAGSGQPRTHRRGRGRSQPPPPSRPQTPAAAPARREAGLQREWDGHLVEGQRWAKGSAQGWQPAAPSLSRLQGQGPSNIAGPTCCAAPGCHHQHLAALTHHLLHTQQGSQKLSWVWLGGHAMPEPPALWGGEQRSAALCLQPCLCSHARRVREQLAGRAAALCLPRPCARPAAAHPP